MCPILIMLRMGWVLISVVCFLCPPSVGPSSMVRDDWGCAFQCRDVAPISMPSRQHCTVYGQCRARAGWWVGRAVLTEALRGADFAEVRLSYWGHTVPLCLQGTRESQTTGLAIVSMS